MRTALVSDTPRAYLPANGRMSSHWEQLLQLALSRLSRLLACGILAALLLLPGIALGEDVNSQSETKEGPAPSEQAAPAQAQAAEASILPPAAITEHSIRLAGVEIPYSAKTATLGL